jgi:pyruvate, orthophosphate dikinase
MHSDNIGGIFLIGRGEADRSLTAAIVGGKASGLASLDRLGFAVPPALAISADVCRAYYHDGVLSPRFRPHLEAALHYLEDATELPLGPTGSLVLAVRSSPPTSMPGVLETIGNVGLNDRNIGALIRRTGDPWLAWDAYRRLVLAFAHTVRGVSRDPFDRDEAAFVARAGGRSVEELDAVALRELAWHAEGRLRKVTGAGLPEDPIDQILLAIEAVLKSWHSPRAQEFRRLNGLADTDAMSVLVQKMVFGTCAGRSGSGVVFTRNPATGEDAMYVDFLFNAQGEDVVSGRKHVDNATLLPSVLPDVWKTLEHAKRQLEREFRDMQDLEFTVEDGRLHFLQVRAGHRTPWATVQIAVDLVDAGILDAATALERVAPYDIGALGRTRLRPEASVEQIAAGVPASPGIATGVMVLDADRARQRAHEGAVILVRHELATDDLTGLATAAGTASAVGGRTSHAAVLARQLGKVCIVGCSDLHIDESSRTCVIGSRTVREGDTITIDGESGCIYAGEVPTITERPSDAIARIQTWRAELSTRARVPGADNIGVM